MSLSRPQSHTFKRFPVSWYDPYEYPRHCFRHTRPAVVFDMPETDVKDDTNQTPPVAEAAPNAGMQGALRFVVVFLISTAVLLSASRYAVGTPLMNEYLYRVANHTSLVLRLFAYSSSLEEAAMRRTNAAGIRNTLSAWAEGQPAPESITLETDATAPPLTPLESWRYRVGRLQRDLTLEREAIAMLEASTLPEDGASEKRLAALKMNLASLEKSAVREGPHGEIRVAYAEFSNDLLEIQHTLENGLAAETNSFTAGLAELEGDFGRMRDRQLAFLTTRRKQLEGRLQRDTGPLVSVILKAGKRRQLDDARAQLAASESESGEANPGLRAKIEAMQAERASAQPEALAKMDRDYSFRFSVVPDCGALPSMAIFVSAMLAFPTRWWKRLVGIAVGVPLLYGINVVRLVCLGVIGAYDDGGDVFDFAHHFVWQGIYIVFVVAIWMIWVEVLVKPGRRVQPASAS